MDVVATAAGPVTGPLRLITGEVALRRWAIASLAANILLVVTGGVVRLTASGLGCPTWPRCTADSYVTHPALGIHGIIEFGNRMLTFVLIAVAVCTWLAARRTTLVGGRRRKVRWIATVMALGIPAQGVLGGLTVLTKLNPYVVALHFLLSMALVALGTWLIRLAYDWPTSKVRPLADKLIWLTFAALWIGVWLGTMTTGSGPHAGDLAAPRTGWNIMLVAHVHAIAIYISIASTILVAWLTRWSRPALLVIAVEATQAGIGLTQYHLGLPIALVIAHLLGAALTVAAATNLRLALAQNRP